MNIKKLNDNAIIPTRGTEYAAGYDLYACIDVGREIYPNQTILINTGIAIEIPEGYAGFVFARSGLATKRSLAPANKVGVIDSDYRGEIIVPLHNHGTTPQRVWNGDRIAQIVFIPFLSTTFNEVDELSETVRGNEGFGSTGTN